MKIKKDYKTKTIKDCFLVFECVYVYLFEFHMFECVLICWYKQFNPFVTHIMMIIVNIIIITFMITGVSSSSSLSQSMSLSTRREVKQLHYYGGTNN